MPSHSNSNYTIPNLTTTYIAHYVGVRRAHVLQYISERPIYELCMEAKRKRGTGRKTFWFEQEMVLEEDEASPASATADGALDFQ